MVPNLCEEQRQNRQSPKANKQTTGDTSGLHIHESRWRQTSAIDVESGMAMAVLVQDKNQQQQYLVRCLQTFMFECGRAQATLSPTTLQTDQEEFILNLLKTVAQNLGANINVRQSPAYSSQSQGSIERYHRTLMGQVRALLQQVTISYNLTLSVQHPILPWIVRRSMATEQVRHSQ